ncbi:MAG: S8 family serine peptidase [Bacteroidota bacterium]
MRYFLSISLALFVAFQASATCDRTTDSLALVDLYNATNGMNWDTTWNLNDPINTWHGVQTTSQLPTSCVSIVRLSDNNLVGTIPSSLGNMTSLFQLSLSNNQLTGTIPAALGNCSELRFLSLSNNMLDGTIPPELGNLELLNQLQISNNKLTGTIPFQLGRLSNLELLYLHENKLTGSIPDSLWRCTNLKALYLQGDSLSGTISPDIGNLTQLEILLLSRNQFSGSLPSTFWSLDKIWWLGLNDNGFTGNIPASVSGMTNLRLFYAWNNNFSGSLPAEIGDLQNLTHLRLYNNNLTGNIPPEIVNAKNLVYIQLQDNNLTGSLPTEIGRLQNLGEINLHNNQLSGPLPSTLGNLNGLTVLRLGNNLINGTIPAELGYLNELKLIYLQNNQLSGDLPPELANIDSLTQLRLDDNSLTGCYPLEYERFCGLVLFNFSNNTGLPSFSTFCNDGSGACSKNDDCADAMELPINLDPCGNDSRTVALNEATGMTGDIPTLNCDSSYLAVDIWFKTTVPSTGNLMLRSGAATNLKIYVEAYEGVGGTISCTSKTAFQCSYLGEAPHVMTITNKTPGEEIYFRVWDSLNMALNQPGLGLAELSVHQLSADPSDWQLCDQITAPNGTTTTSTPRKANEFIVQFDPDATAQDRAAARADAGITDFEECKCADSPLELWKTNNPIETETKRKRVARSRETSQEDTTGYNYVISIAPSLDTLKEQIANENVFGNQISADVAMDVDGNYVVTWIQNDSIYARLFDAQGEGRGSSFLVSQNSKAIDYAVDMKSNGEFIIVWIDGSISWFVSKYDKNGNLLSYNENFFIGFNTGLIRTIDVAINDSDHYIIGFSDNWNELAGYELYDASDNLIRVEEFGSESDGEEKCTNAKVAISNSGKYAITMTQYRFPIGGSEEYTIVVQLYNSNGTPLMGTPYTTVNAVFGLPGTEIFIPNTSDLAIDDIGNLLIVWDAYSDSDEGSIIAKRYNSNGQVIGNGAEQIVNQTRAGYQTLGDLHLNNDGSYLVTWNSSPSSTPVTNSDVYAQSFNSNGERIGQEIKINDRTSGDQSGVAVTMSEAGRAVFAWQDQRTDYDIMHKQYYMPSSTLPLTNLVSSTDTIGINKTPFLSNYNPQNTIGDIIVGVMDSGIDGIGFDNALWRHDGSMNCVGNSQDSIGYDFFFDDQTPNDVDGHGTAVNGRIVSGFPNDVQLNLLNAKFFENGESTLFDAVCGIYYAVEQGAKVLNLSWGFESGEFPIILQDALDYAACQDVLIVTSAGNEGRNNDSRFKYPANLSKLDNNIISVAAYEEKTTGERQLSGYSNFGQKVDIAAPGFVESTGLNGESVSLSGTSLAAPAVTRIAAIIKARYPELTAAQIKDCILTTVDDYDFDIATGGTLNETAALACALNKTMMTLPICESDKIQLNANVTEESCDGNDGIIDLIVEEVVSFEWSNGAVAEDLINLAAGTYMVTATDDCGCIETLSVQVQNECNGGDCEADLVLNSDPLVGQIYRSSTTIESNATVEPNVNAEFQAGQSITLQAGFHAQPNSTFIARIESCTPNVVENRSKVKITAPFSLQLSPNPASNFVNIQYQATDDEQVIFTIYDINGRIVQRLEQAALSGVIGVNLDLPAGMYFVEMRSEQRQMVEKLIVGN